MKGALSLFLLSSLSIISIVTGFTFGSVNRDEIVYFFSINEVTDEGALGHVPDELIIKFRDGRYPVDLNYFKQQYGILNLEQILSQFKLQGQFANAVQSVGLDRLYIAKIRGDVTALAELITRDGGVEYAEPNYTFGMTAQNVPNDPRFGELWGLNNPNTYRGPVTGNPYDADIDAPEAWAFDGGRTGLPFPVGIIDTGIDYNHEDLAANIWTNPGEVAGDGIDNEGNGFIDDIRGWDFVNNDNDPMDDNGHGTHVAGIIGAVGNNGIGVTGVSWAAKLAALKASDAGGANTSDNIVKAITYANQKNFRIANASWGRIGNISLAVLDAVSLSNELGNLFIASAGNSGPNLAIGSEVDIDIVPFYPASYPLENIISITNTDRFDKRSGNFGIASVDLGAPGVTILSTGPNNVYENRSGSSVATAITSGAIALYWSHNPTVDYLTIKDRLLKRTDKIVSLIGTTVSGGRLNIFHLFEGTEPLEPNL